MSRKEIKAIAKDCVKGNKMTYFLIAFVLSLILSTISIVISVLGALIGDAGVVISSLLSALASLLYTGCITVGMAKVHMNLYDRGYIKFSDAWYGFKNIIGNVRLFLRLYIFTFLWSLLLFIPGIVKSYSYALTPYIKADAPNMTAKECIRQSMEIMKGNKMKLFIQDLSFIGWGLLVAPTAGLILFWLIPYMQAARAGFYRELVGRQDTAVYYCGVTQVG